MRKTKEDAAVTKEIILDAALQIFNEKGFSQTSVEDIVRRMDLTRGAFYWHFKDKSDLLSKLIFREHSTIAGNIAGSAVDEADEKKRLEGLLLNLADSFYNSKRYRDYVYLVRFMVEFEPGSFYFKGLTDLNDFITREIMLILKSAKRKKMLSSAGIDPSDTAIHLVSLMDGMFRMYFAMPHYLSDKRTAFRIIKKYVKLLFK